MGTLRSRENTQIEYSETLCAVMMANILNSFLPSKAGDIAKAAFIRKYCRLSSGIAMVHLESLRYYRIFRQRDPLGTDIGFVAFVNGRIDMCSGYFPSVRQDCDAVEVRWLH